MRKSDLYNLTQDVDIEGFSSLEKAPTTDRAVLVRSRRSDPTAVPLPATPPTPRFRRANPVADQMQEPQAAVGVDVPGAAALGKGAFVMAQSEPSQVRYWRTPNRLVKQVWARKAEAEDSLSTAPEVTADHGAHPGEHLHSVVSDSAEIQLQDESGVAPDHQAAAPTPFANISDFAFWEGLSDPVPDEIDAALDVSEPGEMREFGAPSVAPEAPSVGAGNPVAGPMPMAAPVAQWSSAMAAPIYSVSVKLSPRPWGDTGQPIGPAIASPHIEDSPVPGGVVVTRKAREAAAPAPRRRASRLNDIATETAPILSQPVAFELPPITFLTEPPEVEAAIPTEVLQQNAGLLEGVLEDFNVRGEITQVRPGPVVTLYELEPAPSSSSLVTASRYCGRPCVLRCATTFSTSVSETKGPCTRVMRPPPAM